MPEGRASRSSTRPVQGRFLYPGASLLVAVLAVSFLTTRPDLYHPDEGVWLTVSHYDFRNFVLERDWREETWNPGRFGVWSDRQPTIGRLFLGASMFLHGVGQSYDVMPGYERAEDWSTVVDRRPPADALRAARRGVGLLTILSAFLVYLLGTTLTGSRRIGLLASLLFSLDPVVLEEGRRAWLDPIALFFSLLEPPRVHERLHFLGAAARDDAPTPRAKKRSRRGDVR